MQTKPDGTVFKQNQLNQTNKTKQITMKTKMQQRLRPALAGLGIILMMCSAQVTRAQDLIVNDWTSDDGGTFGLDWVNPRSYAYNVTWTFDPTQNSAGDTNSGSMYVTAQWPLNSDPNWNESWNDIQFGFYTPPFNPTEYIDFECAIKIDVTNSSPAIDGSSYGALELIINNPWTTVLGYAPIAITNGWQYYDISFEGIPDETNSEAVIGLISNGGDSLTNTVNYWIGDIVFTALPAVESNTPQLSLAKAPSPGLTCIINQPSSVYDRQMLQTVNSDYSWNTATAVAKTTTYSMTIADIPDASYPGFDDSMFLIPADSVVANNSVDWYSTNVMDFFVNVNADGTGEGTLQYKLNDPADWTANLVVSLQCATGPVGKWSLTFNNNTNVTITAPNNTSTNFTIPPGDAAYFQDPLSLYVGVVPNANADIGQSSTFGQVQVSGAAGSINDNFTSLNPATWAESYAAIDPSGIVITPADAKYWVTWPLPDDGFTNLYASDNLKTGISQWLVLPPSATGWLSVAGNERLAVIDQSTLNAAFGYAPTNLFLGLYHPFETNSSSITIRSHRP